MLLNEKIVIFHIPVSEIAMFFYLKFGTPNHPPPPAAALHKHQRIPTSHILRNRSAIKHFSSNNFHLCIQAAGFIVFFSNFYACLRQACTMVIFVYFPACGEPLLLRSWIILLLSLRQTYIIVILGPCFSCLRQGVLL